MPVVCVPHGDRVLWGSYGCDFPVPGSGKFIPPYHREADEMRIDRDQLFQVVCSIRTAQYSGGLEVGTGFFILYGQRCFIVTAEHVARKCAAHTTIVCSDAEGNPITRGLKDIVQGSDFQVHPQSDIAIAEIPDVSRLTNGSTARALPQEALGFHRGLISRDTSLTTVGFPLGFGAEGRFSPLTFRTFAAAPVLTLPRCDKHLADDFIVLENPAVGGYSGGPVFDLGYFESPFMRAEGDNTRCVGIIHGTYCDQTGGKLGVVTPLWRLGEMLAGEVKPIVRRVW